MTRPGDRHPANDYISGQGQGQINYAELSEFGALCIRHEGFMRDLCGKFCFRRFYVGLTMLPFPGRVFSLYVGFMQNLVESERLCFGRK